MDLRSTPPAAADRAARQISADLPDAELIAGFADEGQPAGQRQAAFHTLVNRYERRLFAVCIRILGSRQDAEEAVQETFVRLARHAHGFRGEAQVSTWLYSIARNVCTDKIRYEARRPATPVDDITRVGHEAVDVDEFSASDTAAVLRDALARLDERSRTLLLLIAVDELSYEEAAEVTGLAIGTVKSRVSRARVQLGQLLTAAADDAPQPAHSEESPRLLSSEPGQPRGPPEPSASR